MRVINHNDGCKGVPGPTGELHGTCDCVSAPLTEQAYIDVDTLIDDLKREAFESYEPHEFTALRFEALATLFANAARSARMRAKAKRAVGGAK